MRCGTTSDVSGRIRHRRHPWPHRIVVSVEGRHCETKRQKPSAALLRQAIAAVDVFVEDLTADELSICVAYGKAVGHRADLNFGDCFAYACAKTLNVALLYKGNDFIHTDLV